MGMPQFTAEASLYRGGSYRAGAGGMPSAGVSAQRVIPANGCPRGWWCCRDHSNPYRKCCIPCKWKLFGYCFETAQSTCAGVGGGPWVPDDGCHFGDPYQCPWYGMVSVS